MRWAIVLAYLVAWACAPAPLRSQDPFFSHSYAVVIGIDRYPHFQQLHNAVSDARAIADYLRTQNYDQVITLYDEQATKQAILAAMQNQLAPRLKKDDRVLVFFAGHGFTETLGGKDRGYFVPYDGERQSAGFISMDELLSLADYMGNARHMLFIMDSCYGGMLGAETRGSLVDPRIPDYLSNIAGRITRQVLTAGGKGQEVVDGGSKGHSVFVDAILEALADGKADRNRDGYITFSELFDYVMQRASNQYQTPLGSVLPGNQGGEYLFRSPLPRLSAAVSPIEPASRQPRSAEPATAAVAADTETRSPVISSTVKKISVAVQNNIGKPVPNIYQGNFRVIEGGSPQTIVDFKEGGPAIVAILIQYNHSTYSPAIASMLIGNLAPADWISVSSYDMSTKILCDFSQDRALVSRALNQLTSSNFAEANLYDAVSDLENRMKAVQGRKAIVVFTDGADTFSKVTFAQALSIIKADGVPVYAIWVASTGKGAPTNDSISVLNAIASSAGGQAFLAISEHETRAAYSAISAALHSYEISYRPPDGKQPPDSPEVTVELVSPQTNAPLRIQDENGVEIPYHIVVKELP
jgi:VWFA-related protein